MKKLFGLLVVLALVLSSCSGYSDSQCRATVESTYPNDMVYSIPGVKFTYLVIDSIGTITSVQTMNVFNSRISSTNIIKKGNK